MKKLFFLIVFLFASALTFAQSQVWVNGYTRSNGTYVQGHYRTAPDYTRNNNWTTVGNVNPHTGKSGTLPGDGYSRTSNYTNRASSYNTTYVPPVSTPIYSVPSYNYVAPSPSYNSTQTIYTGPRGGTYYINSNGNKSYIQ